MVASDDGLLSEIPCACPACDEGDEPGIGVELTAAGASGVAADEAAGTAVDDSAAADGCEAGGSLWAAARPVSSGPIVASAKRNPARRREHFIFGQSLELLVIDNISWLSLLRRPPRRFTMRHRTLIQPDVASSEYAQTICLLSGARRRWHQMVVGNVMPRSK